MLGLLIADDDAASRARLRSLLVDAGYDVLVTDSAAQVVDIILKNVAKVVILGNNVDGLSVAQLLPVLRKCRSDLKIIIASEEIPLSGMRRLRREGIFYHILKPVGREDVDEVRQVVECAFRKLDRPGGRQGPRALAWTDPAQASSPNQPQTERRTS